MIVMWHVFKSANDSYEFQKRRISLSTAKLADGFRVVIPTVLVDTEKAKSDLEEFFRANKYGHYREERLRQGRGQKVSSI